MWLLLQQFYEKYYFLYELCLVFQNLNLNGLFMFLMYIYQVHIIHNWFSYCFTFEVNDLLISGSENYKN